MSTDNQGIEMNAEDLEKIAGGTIKRGPLSDRDKENIRRDIRFQKADGNTLNGYLAHIVCSDEAREYILSVWDQV